VVANQEAGLFVDRIEELHLSVAIETSSIFFVMIKVIG
jgi:hypothetical protein